MELKKNQEILLTIEDFTKEGEGLGKYQGFPLFVKDTVIGDKAKVSITKLKKNYGYARQDSAAAARSSSFPTKSRRNSSGIRWQTA